jgi:hypothetical protein
MSEIIIYQSPDNRATVEVTFDRETVWLNRHQLALLFDRDIKTIGKHLNNVFEEGELVQNSVVAKFATTASDGKTYQVEQTPSSPSATASTRSAARNSANGPTDLPLKTRYQS